MAGAPQGVYNKIRLECIYRLEPRPFQDHGSNLPLMFRINPEFWLPRSYAVSKVAQNWAGVPAAGETGGKVNP